MNPDKILKIIKNHLFSHLVIMPYSNKPSNQDINQGEIDKDLNKSASYYTQIKGFNI